MGTRERWLTVLEVAGFLAIAAAVAVAGYGLGGVLAGVAAGLLALGVEAVYLANAYALQAPDVTAEGAPDA